MQEYKEWDENVLLGPAPTIQNVHKGDIIKAMENEEMSEEKQLPGNMKWWRYIRELF